MKTLIRAIFFLLTLTIYSQINTAQYQLKKGESIMYFDSEWNIVKEKNNAEFYRIFKLGPLTSKIKELSKYVTLIKVR